ncbi:LysE family translocator [Photobacterium sp. 1_MG-2023]|uniref:LysE family translocator n=1 Tax=Photobacterium sp. 1_MG-2023 TaxID=3062646 RepID=UPI0026E13C77|nr:LysE family translocator [Photobacterium sp. 1_MG-2023]MDO6708169.1 LysE family translocator [Photobacterium sp. 1_MG-2023]
MSEFHFIWPILALLTLGAMTPGPSFLLVAQCAMSQSRVHAIAVALGMGCGALVFALLAAFGLVTLLTVVPQLYLTFKILGGAYLCVLAYRIWKISDQPASQAAPLHTQKHAGSWLMYGFTTQLCNPKTALVFSSVFAALLPAEVPSGTPYLISAGVFLSNFGWYACVAILLSTEKAQSVYLSFKKAFCRTAGGLLGIFGLKMMASASQ